MEDGSTSTALSFQETSPFLGLIVNKSKVCLGGEVTTQGSRHDAAEA
jgi:hypothetical protein